MFKIDTSDLLPVLFFVVIGVFSLGINVYRDTANASPSSIKDAISECSAVRTSVSLLLDANQPISISKLSDLLSECNSDTANANAFEDQTQAVEQQKHAL